MIQTPETGDILAVLSTGAYNYSMASNYNRNPQPACVMVRGRRGACGDPGGDVRRSGPQRHIRNINYF